MSWKEIVSHTTSLELSKSDNLVIRWSWTGTIATLGSIVVNG